MKKSCWDSIALHAAARFNKLEVVQFLVNHGADVNAKNAMNKIPLDFAEQENIKKFLKNQMDKK